RLLKKPGGADGPSAEAVAFISNPHELTGTISEPGLGLDGSDDVSVHGHKMRIKGIVRGYCGKVGGCPHDPKVLLVGETPRSRFWSWVGMLGMGLVALLILIGAVMPNKPEPARS